MSGPCHNDSYILNYESNNASSYYLVDDLLGQVGIPVYKSMPYGEIDLVTSYLGRRAIENRGALEKVKKEKQLLARELRSRH